MANHQVKKYIQNSLSSSGIVILNGKLATQLAPGLWGSRQNAHMDLTHKDQRQSLERLLCDVKHQLWCKTDQGAFEVRAMSVKNLSERIEILTGLMVKIIEDYTEPETEAATPAPKRVDDRRQNQTNYREEHKKRQAEEARRQQKYLEEKQAEGLKRQAEKRAAYRRRMEEKDRQKVVE